jgi:hypothetical protein
MTTNEMSAFLGCTAIYQVKDMQFQVEIVDIRTGAYRRIDVLIQPVQGRGSNWVSMGSIRDISEQQV